MPKHHNKKGSHHNSKAAGAGAADAPASPDVDADGDPIEAPVRGCIEALRAWRDDPTTAATLSPADKEFLTEQTLYRYARARKGDHDAALKMLKGTLEWRGTAVSHPLHCARCPTDPTSHCFFPIGVTTDAHGQHPVVYGCPPRASNTDVEVTLQHVIHQLEFLWSPKAAGAAGAGSADAAAAAAAAAAAPVIPGAGCKGSRWVWVVDFRGFGLTHAMQARLGIGFATIFASHFPERLHSLFLLNTPGLFSMLVTALRPFADERTMSKVRPLTGDADSLVAQLKTDGGLRDTTAAWVRGVLEMDPVPGSMPPLPQDAHWLQLPGIKLPGM